MLNSTSTVLCYSFFSFYLVVAIATKEIMGTPRHIPVTTSMTESCVFDVVCVMFGIPKSLFAMFSGLAGGVFIIFRHWCIKLKSGVLFLKLTTRVG